MWRKECTDLDLCRQCIKIERVDWWRENGKGVFTLFSQGRRRF